MDTLSVAWLKARIHVQAHLARHKADLSKPSFPFSFYSSSQDHTHTPVAWKPTTVTALEHRVAIAGSKQTPEWSALKLHNGDFAFAGDRFDEAMSRSNNLIPGWSHHGGGGDGGVVRSGSDSFALELGPGGSQRTHNRVYLSTQLAGISFN